MVKQGIRQGAADTLMKQDEHGGHPLAFFREPIAVPPTIALQQAVAFPLAQVITELGQSVSLCGNASRLLQ